MVRYVWIGTMLAILCIVLYIPSASPPERFTEVLRAEHAASREIWGRPWPTASSGGCSTSSRARHL
jgi:hypothetical protein